MDTPTKLFWAVSAVFLAFAVPAAAQTDFKVCESTYALCTTALCEPSGASGEVACDCEVRTGLSVGLDDCQAVVAGSGGTQIRSRYFPVTSYAICTNDRPWAWCLDKACVVDAGDPTRATCACSETTGMGPYVIVTDTYTEATCSSGIVSSATVTQIDQVTDFLKTDSKLPPFDIKVLNPPDK